MRRGGFYAKLTSFENRLNRPKTIFKSEIQIFEMSNLLVFSLGHLGWCYWATCKKASARVTGLRLISFWESEDGGRIDSNPDGMEYLRFGAQQFTAMGITV
jgi:hypothetical protein